MYLHEYVLCDEASSDHCYCSSCNKYCDPRELELMDEVEYCIVRKNKKLAADEIRKLPHRTIPTDVRIIWIGVKVHVQRKRGAKECKAHLLIITFPMMAQRLFYILTYPIEWKWFNVYFLLIFYFISLSWFRGQHNSSVIGVYLYPFRKWSLDAMKVWLKNQWRALRMLWVCHAYPILSLCVWMSVCMNKIKYKSFGNYLIHLLSRAQL